MTKHTDDNCIFCKLANGEIPTNAIYEDDDFKVILDVVDVVFNPVTVFGIILNVTVLLPV